MKLKEFLERLDPSEKIKMGSHGGSSHFYIGTAGDLLNNLWDYEEMNLEYYDNRLKRAQNTFLDVINADVTYSGYVKRQYSRWKKSGKKIVFSIEGYEAFLKQHSKLAQKRFDIMIKEKQNLLNRVPLEKRKVLDHFDADKAVEPDGVIIIVIDGIELGSFWTTDESKKPKMSYVSVQGTEDNEEGD